jgi:hypothetical protein
MSPALIGISLRFFLNPEYGVIAASLGKLFPGLASLIWLAASGLGHGGAGDQRCLALGALHDADPAGWSGFGPQGDRRGGRRRWRLAPAHLRRYHAAAAQAGGGGGDPAEDRVH